MSTLLRSPPLHPSPRLSADCLRYVSLSIYLFRILSSSFISLLHLFMEGINEEYKESCPVITTLEFVMMPSSSSASLLSPTPVPPFVVSPADSSC